MRLKSGEHHVCWHFSDRHNFSIAKLPHTALKSVKFSDKDVTNHDKPYFSLPNYVKNPSALLSINIFKYTFAHTGGFPPAILPLYIFYVSRNLYSMLGINLFTDQL